MSKMFKGVKQKYLNIQKIKNKITEKFPYHLDLFKNEQNIHLGRWGNHHNKNLKQLQTITCWIAD